MEAQKIEFNLQSLHRKVNRLEEELRGQLFMLQLVIVAMAANEKARREREAQVARTTPVQPQDPLALFLTDVSIKLTAWLESMIETPGPFFIRATTTTAQNPSAQLILSHDLDAASPYLVPLLITAMRQCLAMRFGDRLNDVQVRLRCYRKGQSGKPAIDFKKKLGAYLDEV